MSDPNRPTASEIEGLTAINVGGDVVEYVLDSSQAQIVAVVQAINGDHCITQAELDAFKANNAELNEILSQDTVRVPITEQNCATKAMHIG